MFLTALAVFTVFQADRWVHVGGSTRSAEYLDRESIRRNGSKATVWTRSDFVPDQGTTWNELEFDCSTRTQTILAYIRDDRGTISHNVVRPHRESAPILPGSIEERIFYIVCR